MNQNTIAPPVCMPIIGRILDGNGTFISMKQSSALTGTQRTTSLIITKAVQTEDSASDLMAGRSLSSILTIIKPQFVSMAKDARRPIVLSFINGKKREM